jgi:hypothetical protein
MNTSQIKVPIRPLHVEIEGLARYRQAHTVDDLAGLLLSVSCRPAASSRRSFTGRWRRRLMQWSSTSTLRLPARRSSGRRTRQACTCFLTTWLK